MNFWDGILRHLGDPTVTTFKSRPGWISKASLWIEKKFVDVFSTIDETVAEIIRWLGFYENELDAKPSFFSFSLLSEFWKIIENSVQNARQKLGRDCRETIAALSFDPTFRKLLHASKWTQAIMLHERYASNFNEKDKIWHLQYYRVSTAVLYCLSFLCINQSNAAKRSF